MNAPVGDLRGWEWAGGRTSVFLWKTFLVVVELFSVHALIWSSLQPEFK